MMLSILHVPFGHLYVFFGKMPIQIFCQFLIQFFSFFLILNHMSYLYFLESIPHQLPHLQIFLPFCGLSSHFVYSFLCYTKIFCLIRPNLFLFLFTIHSRRWIEKDVTSINVKEYSAHIFLSEFILSGLAFRSLIHFEFILV